MTKPKATKRKPGRPPKQKIFSAAELLEQSRVAREKSQARLGTIDMAEAEAGLSSILSMDKKKPTDAELKELRRMAERLWTQLGMEKVLEEEAEWMDSISKPPSTGVWMPDGEDLTPKRKNARKPKSIHDLTDKQNQAKGISLEPVPMELDIDATEAELEQRLMQEAVLRKQTEEQRFLRGRRVTGG